MEFNKIPKILINLDKRKDRLEKSIKEFKYLGWDFERFSGIDTNSYIGCGLSHKEIAKLFLERDYKYLMVFEDDIFIMPYMKDLLPVVESELESIEWDLFHFGPSIHRPLKNYNSNLIDLSNPPPKDENKHRGIFGTTGLIYTKKVCELILDWDTNKHMNNINKTWPIDVYYDTVVYPMVKSFSPTLPFFVQGDDFSNINNTFDNNFYRMTYNWNLYCETQIPKEFLNINYCNKLKNEN